jgi:hypothetical protein
MSAHGFKSVFMVGAIAGTALACYLVSLRVASERAELESVENKIVLAQRDIRLLNTEIGTRGRLAQLERWNVKVIRLSAPTADQFVESSFQLATLAKPEARPAVEAPLVYASAPAPARRDPVVTNDDGSTAAAPRASRPLGDMMHIAGYARPAAKQAAIVARPQARLEVPAAKPKPSVTAAKIPAPAAKPVKTATADPLGPLSGTTAKAKSGAGAKKATSNTTNTTTTKESGSR